VTNDRKIIFHGKQFAKFYVEQTTVVQEKIEFVLNIVRTVDKIPKKYFDHLTGTKGLFEIRVESESNIFRIFCCFDEGNLVILFNAFQKKSQKTPAEEVKLAEKLQKEYFIQKLEKQKAEQTLLKNQKQMTNDKKSKR
jgi:phage-related protein